MQVGKISVPYPESGLYPAVGMHSEGEQVLLNLDANMESKKTETNIHKKKIETPVKNEISLMDEVSPFCLITF